MSSQHKAPLAAFVVVSIACLVVVVNALRSDAFISTIFSRPSQVVVAGARLVPAPQHGSLAQGGAVTPGTVELNVATGVLGKAVQRAARPAAARPRSSTRAGSSGRPGPAPDADALPAVGPAPSAPGFTVSAPVKHAGPHHEAAAPPTVAPHAAWHTGGSTAPRQHRQHSGRSEHADHARHGRNPRRAAADGHAASSSTGGPTGAGDGRRAHRRSARPAPSGGRPAAGGPHARR